MKIVISKNAENKDDHVYKNTRLSLLDPPEPMFDETEGQLLKNMIFTFKCVQSQDVSVRMI